VSADEPSPIAHLTLREAVDFARAHQPLNRRAGAQTLVRLQEAKVPRSGWLPRVGATAQVLLGTANNTTSSYLGVSEVDLPRIGATRSATGVAMQPYGSTLVAIGVHQEIYDFGRIAARTAAADALVEDARAGAEQLGLDVILATEEAWYAVEAAHAVLGATLEAEKRALCHSAFAEAGVKSGLRPPIDLTRARAELADAHVRQLRAQTGLVEAESGLGAAIGSPDPRVDVTPPGTDVPESSPGIEEALRLAVGGNPAILGALARIRASRARTLAIGREALPNLFLSAGLSARAGGTPPSSGDVPYGDGWLPDVLNWHAAIVLEWNLFDASVYARRAVARAGEVEAEADLEVARSSVAIAVERAWLDLEAALATVPGLVESAAAAEANQAQADARFRAGLGTAVDLADAESLLIRSQVELAIGRFAALRARATLARAIGNGAATAIP
jgi:outer membrane protein TolC